MQEEFELEAILSVLTGINCTDDFGKVYDLYSFIFEEPLLTATALVALNNTAKRHILNIHPELKNVIYDNKKDINTWVNEQKRKYGEKLTISIVGEPIIVFNEKSYHSNR